MLIKEFRIPLPFTVNEYHVGQLWTVAESSKRETGGGEGVEVLVNEQFDETHNSPTSPLSACGQVFSTGQYTHKVFHLSKKVPLSVRLLAPKGALEIEERAWNAFPYCRTVITNPSYMKDGFTLTIESMHVENDVSLDNIHQLPAELLTQRIVVDIDIANDPLHWASDYSLATDPTKFQSVKTGRGPLVGPAWWKDTEMPIMCAYKLVKCEFKWWGLQGWMENFLMKQEQRIFQNFHRQMFCWLDQWHDLSLADIRQLENQVKQELDEQRNTGDVRGMSAAE